MIINALAKNMTEHTVVIEAQIDPQGYETTVEFWLECQAPLAGGQCETPAGGQRLSSADIPAVVGPRTVAVEMSGLSGGYTYTYRVAAANSAGRVQSLSTPAFETAPLSPPSIPLAEYEATRRIAEQIYAEAEARREAERERTAREVGEEQAARYAAEATALKHREEEEAAGAPPSARPVHRIVPSLRGHTLQGARHALALAHCHLGSVHRPHRRTDFAEGHRAKRSSGQDAGRGLCDWREDGLDPPPTLAL